MKSRSGLTVAAMLATALTLTGCVSSAGAGSIAPLAAEELHGLLVSAEEAGLQGGVAAGDTFLSEQVIPLGVPADGLQGAAGKCGEALAAADSAELSTVGAAAQTIRSSGGDVVNVLLASVDGGRGDSAADLYTRIARVCGGAGEDALVNSATGVRMEVSEPESGEDGYSLRVVETPALESSTVVLVRDLGNHQVLVTGYDTDEETTQGVLEAQVGKMEDWLATGNSASASGPGR